MCKLLIVVVILSVACSSGPEVTVNDIVFHFGVDAKNKLDTKRESFTKDMVVDPPITVSMRLSAEDRDRIVRKAEGIRFFELPNKIVPPKPRTCFTTPCENFYLEIRTRRHDNAVSWNNCNCEEPKDLIELRRFIQTIIESTNAYKSLPEPRGGYL